MPATLTRESSSRLVSGVDGAVLRWHRRLGTHGGDGATLRLGSLVKDGVIARGGNGAALHFGSLVKIVVVAARGRRGDGAALHAGSLVKVGVVLAMADGAGLYTGSTNVVVGGKVYS
jgi:hypothetical protein